MFGCDDFVVAAEAGDAEVVEGAEDGAEQDAGEDGDEG